MDDLRRHFERLDAVPMPDIRAEIDRRVSMDPTPTVRVTAVRQTATRRPVLVLTPTVVGLLVGLLITAVAGGMFAGAWLNNVVPPGPGTPTPGVSGSPATPTPTAQADVTFDCPSAQASAARRTNTWHAGPAPASPRAGWIAAWGSEAQPELVLVNPLTGGTCSLITFTDFRAPPGTATPDGPRGWVPMRGTLAWSPDGGALAIGVATSEPCCRYALYVWSESGLAGPILDVTEPSYLHVPSWSPDGSLLAIGESTGSIPGALDPASAWIIAGDGSAPREVRAGCDACFGGSVYWSPSGDQIAFRTWTNRGNGGSLGIAVGAVDGAVLPLLPGTHGGDALLGWATDESLWVVASGGGTYGDPDQVEGHLFEVPLDPGLDRVDHGLLPDGAGVVISPDGRQLLQVVERPRQLIGDLVVADFPTGNRERLIEGLPSAWGPTWWSPDGRTIGYLVDVQTPDQGIWLVGSDGTGRRKLIGGPLVLDRDVYGLDSTLLKVWQPRP